MCVCMCVGMCMCTCWYRAIRSNGCSPPGLWKPVRTPGFYLIGVALTPHPLAFVPRYCTESNTKEFIFCVLKIPPDTPILYKIIMWMLRGAHQPLRKKNRLHCRQLRNLSSHNIQGLDNFGLPRFIPDFILLSIFILKLQVDLYTIL